MQRRILVIKLSALGDFIQALGAMKAIRRHHADDHLTLVTTAPYRDLAERSGLFDEIWLDPRASLLRADRWLPFISRLRAGQFDRVYDLQWADRTAAYFRALKQPRPEWVGTVEGCSHRLEDPSARSHIRDRQAALLRLAGIEEIGPPDLSFVSGDVDRFGVSERSALLVPGSSPQHRWKRWPVQNYVEVAQALVAEGVEPLLIGGAAEREEIQAIEAACPAARAITGELWDIVTLARQARIAVSNDTGPAFLIEAAGCPLVLLYGERSDAVKLAPRGERVTLIQRPEVADITVPVVLEAIRDLSRTPEPEDTKRATG